MVVGPDPQKIIFCRVRVIKTKQILNRSPERYAFISDYINKNKN